MCPLLDSLGMFRPWTWAMKDRMSLVVCSALKTWCCPLWMGGRWHLVVVLWRSWVRYWSNTSLEPSGIKHTPLFIVQINSDWEEHALCSSLPTWGHTLVIFLSIFVIVVIVIVLQQVVVVLFIQEAEASVERCGLDTGEVRHLNPAGTRQWDIELRYRHTPVLFTVTLRCSRSPRSSKIAILQFPQGCQDTRVDRISIFNWIQEENKVCQVQWQNIMNITQVRDTRTKTLIYSPSQARCCEACRSLLISLHPSLSGSLKIVQSLLSFKERLNLQIL